MSGPEPGASPRPSGPEASGPAFTPALAYPLLTPVYDLALEVLGFGRAFKAAVAELADVKPAEALDLDCGTGTLLHALVTRQPEGSLHRHRPDRRVLAIARRRLERSTPPVELVR